MFFKFKESFNIPIKDGELYYISEFIKKEKANELRTQTTRLKLAGQDFALVCWLDDTRGACRHPGPPRKRPSVRPKKHRKSTTQQKTATISNKSIKHQ